VSHPQAAPAPEPPAPRKAKRWPWILATVAAFVIGIAIGSSGNTPDTSAAPTAPAEPAAEQMEAEPVEPEPAEPAGPATSATAGVYQVGTDLDPGRYKTDGPSTDSALAMCGWSRNSNDSGEFDAIIANGIVEGPSSVTVNDGEFLELTGDCEWSKTS
jgi:hypothetical protein